MQANFLFTTFASAIGNGRRRYWESLTSYIVRRP